MINHCVLKQSLCVCVYLGYAGMSTTIWFITEKAMERHCAGTEHCANWSLDIFLFEREISGSFLVLSVPLHRTSSQGLTKEKGSLISDMLGACWLASGHSANHWQSGDALGGLQLVQSPTPTVGCWDSLLERSPQGNS